VVHQEHEATVGRILIVKHQFTSNSSLPIYILNTGQMHNSLFTQKFRKPAIPLNREQIIFNAVIKELNAKKATQSKKTFIRDKGKGVDHSGGSSHSPARFPGSLS
jgi:hypothetical protein